MSSVYFRLTARGPFAPTRAPLFERWLARADAPAPSADWRAHAFRLIAPDSREVPAVATAALQACTMRSRGSWVAIATPVHLVADMRGVRLPSDGILDIATEESDTLAADFNREFSHVGVRLLRGRGSLLLCLLDWTPQVATTPPEEVAGREIWTHMPRGADAARLRRLASEIEMWLFDQPINARRRARGVPVIGGLWLWGAGTADAAPGRVRGWTGGDDPMFSALAPQSRYPGAQEPGVVTLSDWPGSPAWPSAEDHWLIPAFDDLKAGRLSTIVLSAGDRCVSVSARGLRRFWRKARPWWETLGLESGTRFGVDHGD